MKRLVGAVAIGAVLRLPLGEPASFVTVVQADIDRSPTDGTSAAVSGDGRYVAFTSSVQLAPADNNRLRDIYVLDRVDGRVTLESGLSDTGNNRGDGEHPSISSDGRWLVYIQFGKVMIRDRHHDTTRILGEGRDPVITNDGRLVAFTSSATNVVDERDANGDGEDVYLADVRSGAVRRISVDNQGLQSPSGASRAPTVSEDGRYVAFSSTAPLGATGEKSVAHVYLRDTQLNTTKVIGVGWRPVISADGRHLAFVSTAPNLVADDRNNLSDVFLADVRTGAIELVSRSAKSGSANGASTNPALSSNGRFIAFQSEAADLVCAAKCAGPLEDINLLWDVFVFDRHSRSTSRLSSDASRSWMEGSGGPAMDAAGAVVVFSSRHPIDANDKANDFDLFIRRAP